MKHIVIIGNGIAGITAARHIRKKSSHVITVISAETDHFFSRTALMYIYMGYMKYEHTKPYEDWFWKKNRINLKRAYVQSVNTSKKLLELAGGSEMTYDTLIIASGSSPNKFDWPGQGLEGVQGLYSYQDLELMEKNTQKISRAVIVGGGLIGIEMAEMLLSRKIPVTFLVRENSFWDNVLPLEESNIVNRHIREHHVDLRLSTELKEIVPDENGRVKAVVTGKGERIACEFVGLTVGVSPNVGFLKGSGIEMQRGVLVDPYLQTNVDEIYAIGDCAEFRQALPNRRPIEQVWYTGRMMGETVAETICTKKTAYQPGNWFNSAKFFDIEYQTYGWVWPTLKENEANFYWEHEGGKKCLRFVFDRSSKVLLGVNSFGIRLRHTVIDRWLNAEKTVQHVLVHLRDANFDPEFYKQYEQTIISQFNKVYGTSLKPKKKSWMRILELT